MSILSKYITVDTSNDISVESYLFESLESNIQEYIRGSNALIQIQEQNALLAKIANESNVTDDIIEMTLLANKASLESIGLQDTYLSDIILSSTKSARYGNVSNEGIFDVIDKVRDAFAGLLKRILDIRHDIVKWISKRLSILTGKYSEAYDYLKSLSDSEFKDKTERFFKESKNVEEYGNYILGYGVVDQADLDKQLTYTSIF